MSSNAVTVRWLLSDTAQEDEDYFNVPDLQALSQAVVDRRKASALGNSAGDVNPAAPGNPNLESFFATGQLDDEEAAVFDPDRMLFCIHGKSFERDEKFSFPVAETQGAAPPTFFLVALLRFKIDIQVLSHDRTRFPIWLPTRKPQSKNQLLGKFLPQLRTLSPALWFVTKPEKLVASFVVDTQRGTSSTKNVGSSAAGAVGEDAAATQERDGTLRERRGGNGRAPASSGASGSSKNSTAGASARTEWDPQQLEVSARKTIGRAEVTASALYTPFHGDRVIVIPRLQLVWRLCYGVLRVIWFLYSLVCSCRLNSYRPSASLGYSANHLIAEDDARRRNRNRYHIDVGQDYRHHRHAPGQNPRGEDLTLIVRQALFGM